MGYIIQIPAQVSSHLRALRKAKDLSQAELGARLGLSQTRIARIEGDPLSVSVEQFLRILAALGARLEIDPQTADNPSPDIGSATTLNSESGDPGARADRSQSEGDW